MSDGRDSAGEPKLTVSGDRHVGWHSVQQVNISRSGEPEHKKFTVDIGVATIVAAIVTAGGAAITAVLVVLLSRHAGANPVAAPTVTITAHPILAARPHPTVTVTKFVDNRQVGAPPAAGLGVQVNAATWVAIATAIGAAFTGLIGGTWLRLRRRVMVRVAGTSFTFGNGTEPQTESELDEQMAAERAERLRRLHNGG